MVDDRLLMSGRHHRAACQTRANLKNGGETGAKYDEYINNQQLLLVFKLTTVHWFFSV